MAEENKNFRTQANEVLERVKGMTPTELEMAMDAGFISKATYRRLLDERGLSAG